MMAAIIRVISVDDDPALREPDKFFIENGGQFNVNTLTSSSEAPEQLNSIHYDTNISYYPKR